jgi:hypothetical protein
MFMEITTLPAHAFRIVAIVLNPRLDEHVSKVVLVEPDTFVCLNDSWEHPDCHDFVDEAVIDFGQLQRGRKINQNCGQERFRSTFHIGHR